MNNFHIDIIRCPECKHEQPAKVEHAVPWYSYVHWCVKCEYIIMESEWDKVEQPKKELNLQLPLISKWFEMTKPDGKTEDYREINEYWVKRLINIFFLNKPYKFNIYEMSDFIKFLKLSGISRPDSEFTYSFKKFSHNIMTLGYPKTGDTSRIKKFEHAGIEIREGNPDWGAVPGVKYFVIKHGRII